MNCPKCDKPLTLTRFIAQGGPRGDLTIREWYCYACGHNHKTEEKRGPRN